MHLAPVSFDPQWIKGEMLPYCKDLIVSIKHKHVLVDQSFHSGLLGDKDLKHHTLQPRNFIFGKTSPEELSPTSLERTLSSIANQALCHQIPRLDS